MKRLTVPLVLALLVALVFVAPALAQGPERQGQVTFGRDIVIAANETVRGDLVAFGGDITVAPGAKVTGALAAFGGNVTLGGEVSDSVVAFGGSVTLQPGSVVRQDVTAVGGRVNRADTARVDGYVSGGGEGFTFGGGRQFPPVTIAPLRFWADSLLLSFFKGLVTLLVLTGLAVVLVALFPKPIAGVQATMAGQPGYSAGIGCLALIVAATVTLPLFITCIGPFLLWAAIVGAMVYGLAALGLWVGARLGGSATGAPRNPLAAVAAGTALVVLLLSLLDAVPVVNCVGWVFSVLVASLVLGAVILSKFGTQLPAAAVPPPHGNGTQNPADGGSSPASSTPPAVAEALREAAPPPDAPAG